MPHVLIRHRVADYAAWRPLYDAHGEQRATPGRAAARVFQAVDDPEHVLILFEWDTLEHAREFVESADLRAGMQRAGVVDDPDIFVLQDVT